MENQLNLYVLQPKHPYACHHIFLSELLGLHTENIVWELSRVPTQPGKPGKPGKMRVHLENLEMSWNFEKFNINIMEKWHETWKNLVATKNSSFKNNENIPGNLLKNLEKSWKYHGILSVWKSVNPDFLINNVFIVAEKVLVYKICCTKYVVCCVQSMLHKNKSQKYVPK